jgi:predicted ribosome quality control (RQC) complex YloA/Tae2 family protein
MSYDGLITRAIVNELRNTIIGGRVEKIYVLNNSEVLINIHNNKLSFKLFISINPSNSRVHLSREEKENPIKAPQFCMVLRKHLQGAKILDISQYKLDRIIEIGFENIDDFGELSTKKLVIELMGKHSNIILLNSTNKVIDSIKHDDSSMSSLREVLPAREYFYPENQDRNNFLGLSIEEFISAVNSQIGTQQASFSTTLANTFVGFSRTFTNNLCKHLNIPQNYTSQDLKRMYSFLILLINNIDNSLIELKNIDKDYHINLVDFSTHSETSTPISKFIDEYYALNESVEKIKNKKMELQKEILVHTNKLKKKLNVINESLKEAENLEKYKIYGELISSNIYRMNTGMKEITLENFYDNNEPIIIPLKESSSPSQNAQAYFKKYAKLKNTKSHAESQKYEYDQNLEYLETVHFQIDECGSLEDIEEIKQELIKEGFIKKLVKANEKKTQIVSEPHKFLFENTEILVGKNNVQNDRLTFKIARKTNTWLHTKQIHGSHVIIRSDNVSNSVLEYAAKLAVEHSKAKGSKNVSVDYTLVKNVHKPSGAKPGMVIYSDYKTIVV